MIKLCKCGCGKSFECKVNSKQRFIQHHNLRISIPWNKGLTAKTDKRILAGKNHSMTDRLQTKTSRKKMSKTLMSKPYEWRHRKLSKKHKGKIGDGNRGKRHCNWKGEKPHCKGCGKLLSSYGGIYCHRCSQIGNKGSNWQGGITPLNKIIRYSFEYAQWRLAIFQRDNWTCQICGLHSGCGKAIFLVAHHNKKSFKKIFQEFLQKYKQFSPVKDKNKLINLAVKYKPFWTAEGITYCDKCHKKEHTRLTKRRIKMIDISKLKVGDKVYYQPEHYGETRWENGIIKEIPDFTTDKTAPIGYNCIRVVYNCAGNWRHYKDYTSALTDLRDLKLGWKH